MEYDSADVSAGEIDAGPPPVPNRVQSASVFGLILVVVATRSWLIARAHSATVDTEYHIGNGLRLLTRASLDGVTTDNPPTGSAIAIFPVFVGRLLHVALTMDGWLQVIAVWKSLLAMPVFVVAYRWAREVYGNGAAVLAVLLLLVEPTFAAHTAYATNDTVNLAATATALYCFWRYVRNPSWNRYCVAIVTTAVALAIKQSAVFAIAAEATIAILWWTVRPRITAISESQRLLLPAPRTVLKQLLLSPIIAFLVIWAMLLFRSDPLVYHNLPPALKRVPGIFVVFWNWPAGLYFHSLEDMYLHAVKGHEAFVLGRFSMHGWWYYFPVIAAFKVPIAFGIIIVLAVVRRRAVRWPEVPLLCCVGWFGLMCLTSSIDIGFRHALPCVLFVLICASRGWSATVSWRRWVIVAAVTVAAVDVNRFFPDYLSYTNFHRDKVWLQISDSNLDWGQGLKEARRWAEQCDLAKGRTITILAFYDDVPSLNAQETQATIVGPKVHVARLFRSSLPKGGILIVSPVILTGQYQKLQNGPIVPELLHLEPKAIIGHCLLVYDLDELKRAGVRLWY